jgi:hypothetical protein
VFRPVPSPDDFNCPERIGKDYFSKSGKRREMIARLSFNTACELGFRGSLDEWNRLMGAVARR